MPIINGKPWEQNSPSEKQRFSKQIVDSLPRWFTQSLANIEGLRAKLPDDANAVLNELTGALPRSSSYAFTGAHLQAVIKCKDDLESLYPLQKPDMPTPSPALMSLPKWVREFGPDLFDGLKHLWEQRRFP